MFYGRENYSLPFLFWVRCAYFGFHWYGATLRGNPSFKIKFQKGWPWRAFPTMRHYEQHENTVAGI